MSTSNADSSVHPLNRAISIVGLRPLAEGLGISYQAVLKWVKAGRLPRTEWTGETSYAQTIERLTDGQVTRGQLMSPWPKVMNSPLSRSDVQQGAAA